MPPKKASPAVKPAHRGATKPAAKPAGTAKKTPVKAGPSTSTTGRGGAGKKTVASFSKGKSKGVTSPQAKAPVWTKQDESARTIQKYIRRHLAKNKLKKLKKDKQDYDDLMDNLQKEFYRHEAGRTDCRSEFDYLFGKFAQSKSIMAWIKMVQMEREQAEKERQKEEEERRKRREEAKRRVRILEGAFDGDNDEIVAVLEEAYEEDHKQTILSDAACESLIIRHQLALADCEDANGNTPLSEAAGGGHSDTIVMLIQKGANVNSRGRYHRTPLWRAAFGGHLQAVQTLLEHGGDPRLVADDGTNTIQVAAIAAVEQILSDWDINQTDVLIAKIDADRQKKQEEEAKRRKIETNRLEDDIKAADKENEASQKELTKAYSELNKRIYEHDKCMNEGKTDKKEITLQSIHDAEAVLELVKKKAEVSNNKLSQAKLKLREEEKQRDKKEDSENLHGIKVMIKDLDDVLFRDVGDKISADGRWPLLIDPSSQASTFLRYRDTNYINALNPRHVEAETIRMAFLGALRYGKPVVLDMMEIDMFDTLAMKFDEVQKGLLSSIMTKEILKENKFLQLVRPGDGEQYSKTAFLGARIERFMLVIITKQWNPPEQLMEQTYPLRVIIPSLPDY